MTELLMNAWRGWASYNSEGKLSALLLASLIFLWLYGNKTKQNALLLYTAVMTAACICPVTAAGLMVYQTRFYDYQWIFSMVPQTLVIGLGITVFLSEFWIDYYRNHKFSGIIVLTGLLAILLVCGGMGNSSWNAGEEKRQGAHAKAVLEELEKITDNTEIVLWAPKDILEYAREYDSSIRLPYGRNMWDYSLNAYCYDTYPVEILHLYEWMEEEAGEISFRECLKTAEKEGVNCILISEERAEQQMKDLERMIGKQAISVQDYYLWIL